MALKACRECRAPVSTDASRCPQCGARLKVSAVLVTFTVLAGGLALFMGFAFYLSSLPGAAQASQTRDAYRLCKRIAIEQNTSTVVACDPIIANFRARYGRDP